MTAWSIYSHNPPLPSLWPPLHKLLQIPHRSHAQHKPSLIVRNHRKLVLPRAFCLAASEKGLQLLQRRLHRDDPVRAALALEPRHCTRELVLGLDLAAVEQGLQVRDGDVAQEGAGVGGDDCEVRVVALEGGEEGERDSVGGVEGEGRGRVEVFNGGLERNKH